MNQRVRKLIMEYTMSTEGGMYSSDSLIRYINGRVPVAIILPALKDLIREGFIIRKVGYNSEGNALNFYQVNPKAPVAGYVLRSDDGMDVNNIPSLDVALAYIREIYHDLTNNQMRDLVIKGTIRIENVDNTGEDVDIWLTPQYEV